jgi:hypothetical protein
MDQKVNEILKNTLGIFEMEIVMNEKILHILNMINFEIIKFN